MDSSKNKSSVTLSEQLLWHRGVVIALQLLFQFINLSIQFIKTDFFTYISRILTTDASERLQKSYFKNVFFRAPLWVTEIL